MPDLVKASGLSVGAIYRYFPSKDDIVAAICEQGAGALPDELTPASIREFLAHTRALSEREGHAQLVAQIYAEAAVSPALAAIVRGQLDELRMRIADLLPERNRAQALLIAGSFVALCQGYTQQLAVRADADPDGTADALLAITRS